MPKSSQPKQAATSILTTPTCVPSDLQFLQMHNMADGAKCVVRITRLTDRKCRENGLKIPLQRAISLCLAVARSLPKNLDAPSFSQSSDSKPPKSDHDEEYEEALSEEEEPDDNICSWNFDLLDSPISKPFKVVRKDDRLILKLGEVREKMTISRAINLRRESLLSKEATVDSAVATNARSKRASASELGWILDDKRTELCKGLSPYSCLVHNNPVRKSIVDEKVDSIPKGSKHQATSAKSTANKKKRPLESSCISLDDSALSNGATNKSSSKKKKIDKKLSDNNKLNEEDATKVTQDTAKPVISKSQKQKAKANEQSKSRKATTQPVAKVTPTTRKPTKQAKSRGRPKLAMRNAVKTPRRTPAVAGASTQSNTIQRSWYSNLSDFSLTRHAHQSRMYPGPNRDPATRDLLSRCHRNLCDQGVLFADEATRSYLVSKHRTPTPIKQEMDMDLENLAPLPDGSQQDLNISLFDNIDLDEDFDDLIVSSTQVSTSSQRNHLINLDLDDVDAIIGVDNERGEFSSPVTTFDMKLAQLIPSPRIPDRVEFSHHVAPIRPQPYYHTSAYSQFMPHGQMNMNYLNNAFAYYPQVYPQAQAYTHLPPPPFDNSMHYSNVGVSSTAASAGTSLSSAGSSPSVDESLPSLSYAQYSRDSVTKRIKLEPQNRFRCTKSGCTFVSEQFRGLVSHMSRCPATQGSLRVGGASAKCPS